MDTLYKETDSKHTEYLDILQFAHYSFTFYLDLSQKVSCVPVEAFEHTTSCNSFQLLLLKYAIKIEWCIIETVPEYILLPPLM